MPFVVPAVASAIAWVGGAASALTGMLAAPMVGLLGEGGAIALAGGALKAAALMGASAGLSALMQPKVGAAGSPIAFKADPNAPISGVMGRFGVGGRQVHANVWGKTNLYISFATVLSLGPIQGVAGFTANDLAVTFPGPNGQAANVEPYRDKMWQVYRLGLPSDAALLPPSGVPDASPPMSEWTSAHRLPGLAHSFWTMRNNSKRASYEGGVPRPLWTIQGMLVWDPRLDSTYPGGSGPQRRDDWRTWAYSENPYLHALAWVRGHHKNLANGSIDRSIRLAGVGAPDASIDIGAFVEGANVSDANGWVISGEWASTDDKWQVLAAMLQAGSGLPLNRGAQISCTVNAPRASIYTLTGADIIGPVNLQVMAPRRDRFNTAVPQYRSEAHKWEQVSAEAVTSSVYRAEDGGEPRTREIVYQYVRLPKQAAELAAYDLANARETLKGGIPSKPHLTGLRAGDAFTVIEPELGLHGQKFIVERRSFDPSAATVVLEVRSETDAKHPWALGQSANPPPSPSLTAVDPVPAPPDPADWTVVPRPPSPEGVQQPGLIITGDALDGIGAVLIEVGPTAEGPWTQAYHGPPTTETIHADGLEPGAEYYVAITYFSVKGVPSERTIVGPRTAPGLIAGDVSQDSPVWEQLNNQSRQILQNAIDDVRGLLEEEDWRKTEVVDVLDRLDLGFLLDPVERSAIIRQETIAQGVGPGGTNQTLVAMNLRLVAADTANSQATANALIAAKAYTDDYKAEAALLFATKTERANGDAQTLISAQSYTDALRSYANLTFATQASMVDGLAATLIEAKSYTDDYKSEASLTFATKTERANGDAQTLISAKAYTDDYASSASLTFATKTERANGDALALSQAKAYTDDYKSEASLTFATQSALGGVSATAGIALSTAQNAETLLNEARVRLVSAAGGGNPAILELYSGSGGGSFVRISAEQIGWGANTVFDDATDQLRTTWGSRRRVIALGAPFGPDNLRSWTGPASVPFGSESFSNATGGADGDTVSLWGGQTLSSPFEAGPTSSTPVTVGSGWTTLVSTSTKHMRPGLVTLKFRLRATLSPPLEEGLPTAWVSWRLVSTDASGGDVQVIVSGEVFGQVNQSNIILGGNDLQGLVGANGARVLRLQMALYDDASLGASAASVHSVQIAGLYAEGAGLLPF